MGTTTIAINTAIALARELKRRTALIDANPDVFLWEKIRSLHPLPDQYVERFPNVQAAIGLAALDRLDEWTARTQANARYMTSVLGALPDVHVPDTPPDRAHVYYQYCVYPHDREGVVRRSLRNGLDVEYHHMDVCPELSLFSASRADVPGARRTKEALQLPIHAGPRARGSPLPARGGPGPRRPGRPPAGLSG